MPNLKNKKIVITAGPTREALDPVRFISNSSSGKMGYALAEAAARKGARVVLISGPTLLPPPRGARLVPVTSCREMLKTSLKEARGAHAFIGAAAVSDWRPQAYSARKLKKKSRLTVKLVKNPDILRAVSKRRPAPLLAGFALETENLMANALKKMKEKCLDMIVANGASSLNGADTVAMVLTRGNPPVRFRGSKKRLAGVMLDVLARMS